MKANMSSRQLIDCLYDAGCSDEICGVCAKCYAQEEFGKMLSLLELERKKMRAKLAKVQFELDTLDFLIRMIDKRFY